ncbi:MAG: hypothetical protein ABIR33_04680 [Pyrinomonadaceae bacterium]
MRYLLDVNALIALGIDHHIFHTRVENWVASFSKEGIPKMATCCVRIASQVHTYSISLAQAKTLLKEMKKAARFDFRFIPDGNDISRLPNWVNLSKQTTDGHLFQLSRSNRAVLATLDEGIPNAFVIP